MGIIFQCMFLKKIKKKLKIVFIMSLLITDSVVI